MISDAGDAAVREAEEARRLDPVSPAANTNLSSILWHSGRYEESADRARAALEINAGNSRAYEDLGRACEQTGQFDRAIEAFEKTVALEPFAHGALASLANAYALAGRRDGGARVDHRAVRHLFVEPFP